MATYVNDLRLKEIGTGESSGTWGTETNVNLELIGEALGFGTEAITTNADTHTTTVADGSTDPGRAMYLKYTGTLDSACTITIAPNTISRMQFIENGTSGSQNIIISQGTGANVTIPAGDTKAVYLDGAGSGAAVVDAFASLNTVDLKVEDDLTVTDDASIGGNATVTGTLGVSGLLTANANVTLAGTTPTLTIGDAGAEDTKIVFDGNAQDFYIALDDSADDLLVGLGSTVGTTPAIAIDENLLTTLHGGLTLVGTTPTLTIGDAGAEDTKIVFDGNAQDFYIGLDDSADDLLIGKGSTVGTTPAISIDENLNATFAGVIQPPSANAIDLGVNGAEFRSLYLDTSLIASNELTISTGTNLVVDAASTIKLDAGGGEVQFKDDGTEIGVISMASSNMNIESKVADKDIIFKGIDGSSDVTALTLDMSDAGAATFNTRIIVGSNTVMSSTNAVQFMGGSTQSFGDTGAIGIAGGTGFHITGSATGDMCFAPKGGNAFLIGTSNSGSGPSLRLKVDEDGNFMFGGATSMDSNTSLVSFTLNANNKFNGAFITDGNTANHFGPMIRCGTDDNSGTNTMLTFQDGNGDGIGSITSSGGTVSYGAFTAHHEVNVPDADNPSDDTDAYPYGTLVEVVSTYLSDTNKQGSIRYTVQKSQSANSKKVLGAYCSNMGPNPMVPTSGTYANNLHMISILGDGHIICNNSGGNISVGDGICTSSTAGIGAKATDNPSMIVGIAQEDVTFSGSETKLVPVQFGVQQFTPWS
jgi:hypothetical protein